jgi:signal transduction histidine kinase/DNA-binding response OmpR family regulator
MNVLIAEDNADDRKLLRYNLEFHGCTVIEAQNGLEGVSLVSRHKPDLIISDALMPRMDGFQFLRTMKSDPELASIPFLFHSAVYTGDAEEGLALSLGAAAFVVKPVEPELLWKKICAVMESASSGQLSAAHSAMNEGEEHFLREYGRIVATKLEEKVAELQQSLTIRAEGEEQLRRVNEELTREAAERLKAETALRAQEQELSAIFDNAPFIMLFLDEERKVHRANALARSLGGASVGDALELRSGEALRCLHALDVPEGCGFGPDCHACLIRQTVLDTFATGKSHHQIDMSLQRSVNGKVQSLPLLLSTTKVMVAGKAMVLLSLQDVSELRKLEAQLFHAQKMESIGTLAGGIAHDFNNILTAIFGYGDIALMNMSADDPQRDHIDSMLQASQRAATLAKDLLLFSRKQASDRKHVDLNAIVRSVEKFLFRIIGEDVSCAITLGRGTLPVLADVNRFEQVLMNLATNARDAMPEGGTLKITTGRIRLDDAFVAAQGYGSSGMYALLTVSDSGMGMDEETSQQIFDPFFTTKEVGKGTGLGLAVVYGIVKQHDGYIMVNSEPGQGTTFRIYLPLAGGSEKTGEAVVVNRKPERGSEAILLAEDDETVRDMAVSLLESFGYEVISAVDGIDAVKKYRDNRDRIRLLLFDVIMPNKNGIDAYEEIRSITPDIKVIFASGYSAEAVHQKARENSNVMAISKPYLPSSLLALIRTVLDK